MSNENLNLFATSPRGLELLLVDELKSLGAVDAAEKLAGVTFTGNLELAYKACLWSRLANRILLQLGKAPASSPEELYKAIQAVQWDKHVGVDGTFAVHAVCSQSVITHTLFAAQKVKDAIVDQFRDKYGKRPNVDKVSPNISVFVYIYRDQVTIYIDLSGDSLHRRGYRPAGGSAPLKENLAAAILIRAGWPDVAKEGGSLMDPMCGSGTLLIEAALMAADVAPGLNRDYFGFSEWKQHQAGKWQAIYQEACQRKEAGIKNMPLIEGYDIDAAAIKIAFENIERAGMRGKIHVEKRALDAFAPKANAKPGLVVVNPPYGERLGEADELAPLYTLLGDRLKAGFEGWRAAVFTGNPDLGKQMGLRSHKQYALFNGDIPCKLLLFNVLQDKFIDRSPEAENKRRIVTATREVHTEMSDDIQMFVNRMRKNVRHLSKKAKREGLKQYRVYDMDLPEYAFSIDVADDQVLVQEYQAPRSVDTRKVERRRNQVLAVLPELLSVAPEKITFKLLSRK